MPLFDAYVMVDWSGGDRRRGGRQDCIWIAHGAATAREPATSSPCSRTEAEDLIRSLLEPVVESKERQRLLLCADFGYGYPAGFASLLRGASPPRTPPWRAVWDYLAKHLQDDLGTRPDRKPTNRSNRFEVASAINAQASGPSPGPFWCLFRAGGHACIPQRQPAQPFPCDGGNGIQPLRITDRIAQSNTPFRLFGTGSVGSQILTGVPRLHAIRFDPQFADCSAVWPFETGWAPGNGKWLDPELHIIHAAIYPSVRRPLPDSIKDRGQVRAMWHWACRLDSQDRLLPEFAVPPGITGGSAKDVVIRREEGWILGCSVRRPNPSR